MPDSFEATINKFCDGSKELMLAVAKQSLQEVINEMQTPVAKGGRMRVLSGFLRASGRAALNTIPRGPIRGDRKAAPGTYAYDSTSVTDALIRLKLGDVFYFGWTAIYARTRETYDGFMETALQNWQQTVDKVVRRLKK